MPLAARQDDELRHSFAFSGAIAGLAVGAIIGSAVMTGGLSLVAIGGLAAGIGMGIGELIGSHALYPKVTGHIAEGSSDVTIEGQSAARVDRDAGGCEGSPPLMVPHFGATRVAEGSATVLINGDHAARMGDRIDCGAVIDSGAETVNIGGPTLQILDISGDVPVWFTWLVNAVSLGTTLLEKGAIHAAVELLGVVVGDRLGEAAARPVERWVTERYGAKAGEIAGEVTKVVVSELAAEVGPNLPGHSRIAPLNRFARFRLGLDPVDLGSGQVVDAAVDLALPGAIPLEWRRQYSSANAAAWTSLGRGGWTLNLEQWVVRYPGTVALRDEEGRDIHFPPIAPGQSAFIRAERLVLTALGNNVFEVFSLDTRLTRSFAPLGPESPSVLRSIRDAFDNTIALEYTGGNLTRVVDTAGRELRVKRGHLDLVARVEVWVAGKMEQSVSYGYDARGGLESVLDALGGTQRHAYDDQHRLARKTIKNGVSFHYEYDDRTGWCRRVRGDGGLHAGELRIDAERRITYLTGTEEPRVLHWDERGLVVREETPDGALLGAWEYDADQQLVAETNGAGETTRHEYDARGNLVRQTDAAGNVTAWEYERDLPRRRVDPDGLETRFTHDARGALVAVTYPSGQRLWIDRDERGRVVAERDDEGPLTTFKVDQRHEVIEETDARGATTRIARDALGRPVRVTDALGHVVTARYDALGRAIEVERAGGALTRAQYDALGNLLRVADRQGRSTLMRYAGTGQLGKIVHPDGSAHGFEYTPGERLKRAVNARGEAHELGRDAAGRLAREATFDGREIGYRWSAAGRLERIDYPDGSFRAFAYDRLGKLVREASSDAEIRYERDRVGRLLGAVVEQEGGAVRTHFERDRLGRLVAERQGDREIRFALDAHGRRVERALPDGTRTRYGYDAAGDLAWVEHGGVRLALERDALGRVTALRDGAGAFAVLSAFDGAGRLVEQQVEARAAGAGAGAPEVRRELRHDDAGRVQHVDDARWGASEYRRDEAGRLLEVRRGRRREVFAVDPAGGVIRVDEGREAAHGWEIARGGLLLESGRARYEYDARRRRVRRIAKGEAGAVTEYAWDCRDRLREVRLSSGVRVRFAHDAFGRRVRKEIEDPERGFRVIEYVWDGGVIAGEIDGRGGGRAFVHVPGTFEPLLQAQNGEVYTYVVDPVGAPSELLDRAGRAAWAAARGAFGDVTQVQRDPAYAAGAQEVASPLRLLGQWAEEEAGLCLTLFRAFDPEVGRFCSPDPIGLAGGMDLFGLNGDPTVHADPLGLCPIDMTTPRINLAEPRPSRNIAPRRTRGAYPEPIRAPTATKPPVPASPDPNANVVIDLVNRDGVWGPP